MTHLHPSAPRLGLSMLLPVLTLAALLLLPGCAAPAHFEDPVAVMNSSKDPDQRMAAARQAARTLPDDPGRLAALERMVWNWGHSDEERQYAIDQLLTHNAKAFRKQLATRILMIKNPLTVAYIMKRAAQEQWQDFTPAIVRSYERVLPSNIPGPRPEIAALKALNPGKSMDQIVFGVFTSTAPAVRVQERTAAWELLWKLSDQRQIVRMLDKAPDSSAMIVDFKAAWADLHCLPRGREGILRLAYLRDTRHQAIWDQYKQAVARLRPQQSEGLELRHLPILVELAEATFGQSREELVQQIGNLMDQQDHYLRGPNYDGPMRDYPQRFAQAVDQLCWTDLATIQLIFHAVQQPAVTQAFFAQADADLVDTTTEHGGVLLAVNHVFEARAFDPLYRQQNYKFIPPDTMITALYTGLAHYHFHAQSQNNRDFAGPGVADMRLARNLEMNAIVLTFINSDTLNVDYYQPNGAVVDLGVIRRSGNR